MIVGNGDIAGVLNDCMRPSDDSYIFFASGVSNSQEERDSEYDRELALLLRTLRDNPRKHIVYFSSLSIFYKDTRYTQHKREIEAYLKTWADKYTIVRIGNITWGSNPHTLLNFIREKLEKGEEFEIEDTYRYIVDKEEFRYWINMIPEWNCEMNIPGKRMKVSDIVEDIKGHIEKYEFA